MRILCSMISAVSSSLVLMIMRLPINEGMDCKRHMDLMSSVWHHDNAPVEYTFGEAIIPKSIWKDNFEGKINPLNGQPYKSARNTVAGLFRRDDPPSELLKHVYFMRYGAFGEGVDNFLI